MRIIALAAMLLVSSSSVPSFAEDQSSTPSLPQATPVQPERSPQQSDQSQQQDRNRAGDVQVGRDWRAHPRDDRGDNSASRDRYDNRDDRTVGRNWRMDRDNDREWDRRDDYRDRGYIDGDRGFDEQQGRRRVKICMEYENGDEYCRYR
jgi:hypothetical protein